MLEATGRDICETLGPSPRRPRDWVALMRRVGAKNMAGVITSVHGAPIPTRAAMRGDIVKARWAIGICRGEHAEFYGGVLGSMADVDAAWRVRSGRAGLDPINEISV